MNGGMPRDLAERAWAIARRARLAADQGDPRAFPTEQLRLLAGCGFLTLPLGPEHGGLGWGRAPGTAAPLSELLAIVGWGDLSLARIYEGHINALLLLRQFGDTAQIERAARDAQHGLVFGVWNTEGPDGLRLTANGTSLRLEGEKTFASGAGSIERPLVTARDDNNGWQLVLLEMERAPTSIDRESWKTFGMRGSQSFSIDLSGARIDPRQLIGHHGDYYRQPWFTGGAVRFCAAQLGGAAALLDLARDELCARNRAGDSMQRTRIGVMAASLASGFAMLGHAATLADASRFGGGSDSGDDRFLAYAGLTRTAIERICLDIIETVEQSLGASALMATHPAARIGSDLRLYLRQPAPDAVLLGAADHVLSAPGPFMRLFGDASECTA